MASGARRHLEATRHSTPRSAVTALSILYTLGTLVVTALLARSSPHQRPRWLTAWIALLLLVCNRTFAVWSTSGLETRQFTFFAVAAIYCTRNYRQSAGWLWAASMSLGAAELTRPEGLLLAACCIAWLIVDAGMRRRFRVRDLAAISIPFGLVVIAHFLFPLPLLRRVPAQHLLRKVREAVVVSRRTISGHVGAWRTRFYLVGAPRDTGYRNSYVAGA